MGSTLLCETCRPTLSARTSPFDREYIDVNDVFPSMAGQDGPDALDASVLRQSATEGCIGCQVLIDGADKYFVTFRDRFPNIKSFKALRFLPLSDLLTARFVFPADEEVPDDVLLDDASFEYYVPFYNEQAFSEATVDWKAFAWAGHLQTEALSPSRLAIIRAWRNLCKDKHEKCGDTTNVPLPTRVLEITREDGRAENVMVRLVETNGARGEYFALSHRWGDPSCQPLRTLKGNIEHFKEGIAMESLPRSFRDAITVTDKLGVRFLWIDSLCIVQDDKDDWAVEGARMTEVYSNASITIAAANADNSTAGFLRAGDLESSDEGHALKVKISDIEGLVYVRRRQHRKRGLDGGAMFGNTSWSPELDSVLHSRAWCFQEQILPPRLLEFLQHEVVWTCCTMTKCECRGGAFERPGYDRVQLRQLHQQPIEQVKDAWYQCVTYYSSRNLTYFSDRFPAVSGVARFFGENVFAEHFERVDYIAGLWSDSMIDDLQWMVMARGPDVQEYDHSQSEVAPSWSWASVPDKVGWNPRGGGCLGDYDVNNEAQVVNLPMVKDNIKHFEGYGALVDFDAPLALAGFQMPVKFIPSEKVGPLLIPEGFEQAESMDLSTQDGQQEFCKALDLDVRPDHNWASMGVKEGEELVLFLMATKSTGAWIPSHCMLVAQKIEDASLADYQVYRRIGFAICSANTEVYDFAGRGQEFLILR
ncbi:heterokaryon incompatibility protein-domain-containing protein [Xylaria flabelliformis]|nr:heterokaryon incompatibility protein-domain-containing protein [Xylaria flabelliformis]